jgi:hypothetical protein
MYGRSQTFDVVQEISDVISELTSISPNRKIYKNYEYKNKFARDIYNASIENNVPEFLLTVKAYNESSFKNICSAPGPSQTCGELQMHGVATKNCDLSTRKGRLNCGAKWLRVCFDKCKTWPKALAAYGTSGHCNWKKAKHPKKYKRSIDRQVKLWMKFEQQRQSIRNEIISDIEFYKNLR